MRVGRLALQRAALRLGARPILSVRLSELDERLLREGFAEQLALVSPIAVRELETADAAVTVRADTNTRLRSRVDPARERARAVALGRAGQRLLDRSARGEARWCGVLFPTQAHAQDAVLPLDEYTDFVLGACHVDEPDPAGWAVPVGHRGIALTANTCSS